MQHEQSAPEAEPRPTGACLRRARTVIFVKRSMNPGFAGVDNELFYLDKTMLVFGDAKKVVEDMAKAIE